MRTPYFFSFLMLLFSTVFCVEKSFSVINMQAATRCIQILRGNLDYKDLFEIPRRDTKEFMDLVKIMKEKLPDEFAKIEYIDENFLNEYQKADRVIDSNNGTVAGCVAFEHSTGAVMTSESLLEVVKVIRINFLKNKTISTK